MAQVAVFDINETTLDLSPVRAAVDDALGHMGGFTIWFQKLLQLSMAATVTDNYVDFSALGKAAFGAVGGPADGWDAVGAAFGELRAYPDVAPGLASLREAGWSTIALTNSAPAAVASQLDGAGVAPLFDQILSVDAVRAFKPSAEPYRYAAAQAGVDPSELWMVACHDWDLAGARAVGLSTAYVARPDMSYASVYPSPEVWADDFVELAEVLLERPD